MCHLQWNIREQKKQNKTRTNPHLDTDNTKSSEDQKIIKCTKYKWKVKWDFKSYAIVFMHTLQSFSIQIIKLSATVTAAVSSLFVSMCHVFLSLTCCLLFTGANEDVGHCLGVWVPGQRLKQSGTPGHRLHTFDIGLNFAQQDDASQCYRHRCK